MKVANKTSKLDDIETYEEKMARVSANIRNNINYTPTPVDELMKGIVYQPHDLDSVMARIRIATHYSPIIVVKAGKGISSCFAGTVIGDRMMEKRNLGFIGVFHKDMDLGRVEVELNKYIV